MVELGRGQHRLAGRAQHVHRAAPERDVLAAGAVAEEGDPVGVELRRRIGVDNIMFESDYPHSDSTWPYAPEMAMKYLDGLAVPETARLLGVSEATVHRDWRTARAWLAAQLRRAG